MNSTDKEYTNRILALAERIPHGYEEAAWYLAIYYIVDVDDDLIEQDPYQALYGLMQRIDSTLSDGGSEAANTRMVEETQRVLEFCENQAIRDMVSFADFIRTLQSHAPLLVSGRKKLKQEMPHAIDGDVWLYASLVELAQSEDAGYLDASLLDHSLN